MLSERDLENPDPLRLSREIGRADDEARRLLRALRRGELPEAEPFVATRPVTTRLAFQGVRDLPAHDPLREPLLRAIHRLLQLRVNVACVARVAAERYVVERVVREPEARRLPHASLLHLGLEEPGRREAWLAGWVGEAAPVGAAERFLWERRHEVAVRLGLSGPDELELPDPSVVQVAGALLDATDDAARSFARGSLGGQLSVALAEGAPPQGAGRLRPRALERLFRETDLFRGLELDPGDLPAERGPATWLRALARVGSAFSRAAGPRDQPHVIAVDPLGLRARTHGALFAALPLSAAFAHRALGVDPSQVTDHRRFIARSLIFSLRLAALRVCLRGPALSGGRSLGDAFEAGTLRVLGVPLPPQVAGAVVRLAPDDGASLAGALLAASLDARLREHHDDDWYRNPRAAEQLRDEARLSPGTRASRGELEAGLAMALSALLPPLG